MSDYVPTIDDLRVKLCFICREEEFYDNPADPPQKWTHPCQCTLLAHEDCLLEWIKTAQANPSASAAEKALKCPQCGAKYQLESDLPLGMRIMNEALNKCNSSLGAIGKWFVVLIPVGLVTGVAIGTHSVLTHYGAYAVREFFGNEVFDALLTWDTSNWPRTALINLPLIPIGLISYRFKSTYNFFPIISVLLEWPEFQRRRIHGSQNNNKFLSWPPSLFTVGFVVLPLARFLYGKCLARVTRRVLGLTPRTGLMNADVEDDRMLMVRFRDGAVEEAAEAVEENPADGRGGGASITINASPIGRKIGGALLVPFIAKHMGNLLFRLSKNSELLRKFLAVRTPAGLVSSVLQTPSLPPGKRVVTWRLVLRMLWGGGRASDFEPIWWRNTLGFGMFVVVKDTIHLLHLYLVKREIETRRVKNRDFRDIDMSGLDVMPRRDR